MCETNTAELTADRNERPRRSRAGSTTGTPARSGRGAATTPARRRTAFPPHIDEGVVA